MEELKMNLIRFFHDNIIKDSCLKDSYEYLGNSGETFQNVGSAAGCQWQCQLRSSCTAFNFHKKFQYCLLYGSANVSTGLNPYFVTGPRICGNNGSEFDKHIFPIILYYFIIIYMLQWRQLWMTLIQNIFKKRLK